MARTSIATLQSRQQLVDQRQTLFDGMTPALQEKCRRLEGNMLSQAANNLRFYYTMGKEWLDARDNPKKYLSEDQRVAGVDVLDLMQQFFAHSHETMRKAMSFAARYTEAELERVLGLRNEAYPDYQLHWGHVIQLLSVEGDVRRRELEQQAVDNGWTPRELQEAIVQFYGGPRRAGGRPLGIPKTVPAQLSQIKNITRVWLRRYSEVWHGEDHSVYTNVLNMPPDKYSPEMLTSLDDIKEMLRHVQEAAQAQLAICERTQIQVSQALKHKPNENGAALLKVGRAVGKSTTLAATTLAPKSKKGKSTPKSKPAKV